MAPRISLALVIHNHQPVGNFGWVVAEAFEKAYAPLVGALLRHPTVRLSLHYSGPLFEWIRSEHPAFVEQLATLVARDQVELVGGGWYEPVLASLPERDRLGQLTRMADELERTFGRRPKGAWLAERVWEPSLPTSLVDAGYEWTVLDDAHLRSASVLDDAHWGAYTTEDQGRRLSILGTEQGLRYLIPFHDVPEVIDHLRDHASDDGRSLGVMGDDGEKFGSWPATWEHSWGANRWVERFFEVLEKNMDWLATVTPSEWLGREPPIGRIYIPTGSYLEMTEWALPADESLQFARAVEEARAEDQPIARWLRGGFWRNFQVRYREINDLHKQMLRTSERVAAMPIGPERERAVDHLYAGQSNDCYWHGLFGGIYISHMRLATYEHLIAAQDLADATLGLETGVERDLDLDGRPDVLLANEGEVVTIVPHEGAGIGSWDIRAARHALTAVMRRRPEAYHSRLRALADRAAEPATDDPPASIHDVVTAKEAGLADRLIYDRYERRSGLVRVLVPHATPESFADASAEELVDAVDGAFDVVALRSDRVELVRDALPTSADERSPTSLRVEQAIEIAGARLAPRLSVDTRLTNTARRSLVARVGVEFATTMLGGGGNPAAWWELDGGRTTHDATRTATGIERLRAGNDDVGIVLELRTDAAVDAWIAPIETISNSEAGFERVYQGSALLLSRLVEIEPGASVAIRVVAEISVARDRAVEEAAALALGNGSVRR